MRPDTVSGAVFPNHELSGDAAKRQKLREADLDLGHVSCEGHGSPLPQ